MTSKYSTSVPRRSSSPRYVAQLSTLLLRRALRAKTNLLQVTPFGCESLANEGQQALGLTYWFEAAHEGEPYSVTIRFSGRLVRGGEKDAIVAGDTFNVIETVENVIPGSGRLSVTVRVIDVAPGEWHITAVPINERHSQIGAAGPASTKRPRLPSASASGSPAYAPVISVLAPGVYLGAWPIFVGFGALLGLGIQAVVAAHSRLHVVSVLIVSLAASAVGLVGAKVYYLVEQRLARRVSSQRRNDILRIPVTAGMCIQGFVIGTVATLYVGSQMVGVPIGRLLDVTVPALFFGMTIGRFGCFFGGCCVGRPTASHWGVWSSDRHLGVRRIPSQLFESAFALLIGLSALAVMWTWSPRPAGIVFIGTIAAYTFGRQLLFRFRMNSRMTAYGPTLTMAFAGAVLVADLVVALLS